MIFFKRRKYRESSNGFGLMLLLLWLVSITLPNAHAVACPTGHWGSNCEGDCHCALKTAICRSTDGHCMTGGCKRGFTGAPSCQTPCGAGSFGVRCESTCHCPVDDLCDPVNGLCSSHECLSGYEGAGCQTRLPVFAEPPNITSITQHTMTVSWRPWSSTIDPGAGPIAEYHLQYTSQAASWSTYDLIRVRSLPEPARYSREVTGLVPLTQYQYRVSLARDDEGKVGAPYPGPETTAIKACSAPKERVKQLFATQELETSVAVRIYIRWEVPESSTSGCSAITSHQVELQCDTAACTTQVLSVPMPQKTYTFTGIPSYISKEVSVAPVNDAAQIGPSDSLVAIALTTREATPATHSPDPPPPTTTATTAGTHSDGQSLVLHAATETSLELTWPDIGAPKYEIELVTEKSYQIPSLSGKLHQKITLAGNYLLVHSLHAATLYNITVTPSVGIEAYTMSVWTNPLYPPAPPNPTIIAVTQHTVTLYLKPLEINTGPLTAYLIVVEYWSSETQTRKKRQTEENLDDKFKILKGYEDSQKEGLTRYITAELTGSALGAGLNFTIGDGRSYNEYFNAPLDGNTKYTVWLGLISTLAGVTRRTFVNVQGHASDGSSFSTPPVHGLTSPDTESSQHESSSNTGLTVGLIFFFLILFIACGLIFYFKKKRGWKITCPSSILDSCVTKSRFNKRRRDRLTNLFGSLNKGEGRSTGFDTLGPIRYRKHNDSLHQKSGELTVDEFVQEYVASSSSKELLADDFQKLPRGLTSSAYIGTSVQNIHLNRNSNIVAYDYNRLCMVTQSKGENDYINATLLRGSHERSYIVTQSPLPLTISHFWKVVWDYRICQIVMLMDIKDESTAQIPEYWPKEGNSQISGQVEIKLVREEKFAFHSVRSFELRIKNQNEIRYVRQLQYTDWQSPNGIPSAVNPFLEFLQRCHRNSELSDICVVNCQTGGGRSGLFVALDILLQQARSTGKLDAWRCVHHLRLERPGMVKNLSQFHFIHQALVQALSYKDSVVTRRNFTAYMDNLNYVMKGKNTCMQIEFNSMMQMTPDASDGSFDRFKSPGKLPVHPLKSAIAPKPIFPITFVDSYRQKGYYLLLEHPSEPKISNLWNCVKNFGCSCIVRLSDPENSMYPFIPDPSQERQYGNCIVRHDFTINHSEELMERHISLGQASKSDKERTTKVIVFHLYWREEKPAPSAHSMLDLWRRVVFFNQTQSGRVAVVSGHGSSRSALFPVSAILLEKMETEGEVDIYQSVKHLRTQVPEAVATVEQYRFCYRLIKEYLKQTDKCRESTEDLSATIPTHPFKSPHVLRTSTPKRVNTVKQPTSPDVRKVIETTPKRRKQMNKQLTSSPKPYSVSSKSDQISCTFSSSQKIAEYSGVITSSSGDVHGRILDMSSSGDTHASELHRIESSEIQANWSNEENNWQEILREAARLREQKTVTEADDIFLPLDERIQRQSLLYESTEDYIPKPQIQTSPLAQRTAPQKPARSNIQEINSNEKPKLVKTSPKKSAQASRFKEQSNSAKKKARLAQIGKALPSVGGYGR